MRPTFRETVDKELSNLKFTENMRLSVIVHGRRRVHYTRRIVSIAAVFLLLLSGVTVFLSLRPDAAPDRIAVTSPIENPASENIYSSDNFDVILNSFSHEGMHLYLSYSLASRADHDVIVIRSPFEDDDINIQNRITIEETKVEPAFAPYAEQAIYLPAGGCIDFEMTVSMGSWLPGDTAELKLRFDFLKPAIDITPEKNISLTDAPLLILTDELHVDIAHAVTALTEIPIEIIPENQKYTIRDWPNDLWAHSMDRSYSDLPRQLAKDGVTEDDGERIDLEFSLYNQPGTLVVETDNPAHVEGVTMLFAEKYPDINIYYASPNEDTSCDIVITSTYSADFANMMANAGFIPYVDKNNDLYEVVNRLYPSIRAAITHDAYMPAALPIAMTAETPISWNPSGFAQLRLTESDVPETWHEFLELLQKLPELNGNSPMVTAFPWTMSVDEVKRTVFDELIYACAIELARDGSEFDPDHHYIRRLMLEFEKIDFEAICLPVGSAANSSSGSYLFSDHGMLAPCESEYNRTVQRPMPLSLFSNFEPVVNLQMTVAYIRSGCDSYSYAIEYLELLASEWRDDYAETFFADYIPAASSGITPESLAWYRSYIEHAELTPATLDADISKYLYDLYFYTDN